MSKRRIQIDEFIDMYERALREDMTREDFAESIGVTVATVYGRVSELRAKGVNIPQLRTKTQRAGRESVLERALKAFGSIEGVEPKAKADKPEPKKPAVKKVKPEVVANAEETLEEIFGN